MSARVNLLPPQLAERKKARRVAQASTASVACIALALGAGYVAKVNAVEEARGDRDRVQAGVVALERQVAALDEYRQLANRLHAGNAMLAAAMETEVSWARVLNDLSMVFPSSGSMESLTAELTPVLESEPLPGAVVDGDPVASLVFNGYSVERFSPGVEAILVDFDGAEGFYDSYLTNAATEEKGDTEVTKFTGRVRLDEHARTNRYVDGLPKEIIE